MRRSPIERNPSVRFPTDFNPPIEVVRGLDDVAQRRVRRGPRLPHERGADSPCRRGSACAPDRFSAGAAFASGSAASGRNSRIETGIPLHQVASRRQELFIREHTIAAGVGGDDRDAFIQCRPQAVRITHRLVLPDQAEFVADVAQERELALGEGAIIVLVPRAGWVELFGAWGAPSPDSPASAQRCSSSMASRRCGLMDTRPAIIGMTLRGVSGESRCFQSRNRNSGPRSVLWEMSHPLSMPRDAHGSRSGISSWA